MSTTMTIKERKAREERVLEMLNDEMTVPQIAKKLDVSPQAVRKFLSVRGWVAVSAL